MAPPLPTVAQQGQGSVGADQLNTYVQVVRNFAQLRTFTALDDMAVFVLGGSSEGDGLQGWFWYNSTSTATDNGSTVIEPTGASGAWLLLPPGSNSPGNFASLSVSGNGAFGGNLSVGGTLAVTGVAAFAADLSMSGTGEIVVPAGTTGQRNSVANGAIRYNTTLAAFEGYGASGWQPLAGTGVAQPPNGRLTLTSGVPVLASAVIGASGLIWTPFNGATVPQWNGSAWSSTTFPEISQVLSDTVNSPAAAVAGGLYDMFVWFKAGVATLSRGPAWTSSTARSLNLSRVQGFLVNSLPITNGPAAGYGFYVGTIACDAGAATVTFNPQPAAASGGPTNGAGLGLWNQYNRVPVVLTAQDSKASWTYTSATWHAADASNNNRITFVTGQAEDGITASYSDEFGTSLTVASIGIALDSTTTPAIAAQAVGGYTPTLYVGYAGSPVLGQHYLQAMEATSTTTQTFFGLSDDAPSTQVMQLSAQLRF
jgi:hypothetical protein